MNVAHVVGVDPGIVHTGVVMLVLDPKDRRISVGHRAVAGAQAQEVHDYVLGNSNLLRPHIFIEGYRPRSHYDTDARMAKAVNEIKAALPGATVLNNTGVKKVVKQPLMELLGVWKFSTPTHHQDLRSAARIALLGMMKDEQLNRLLADVVKAHLDGRPWDLKVS